MSEATKINWTGKSGTKYQFWIHPRGKKFREPCPGIYIHAKETKPHTWTPVYIGQTENINVRLTNHEQEECVNRNNATHIHVRIVTDETSRLAIEKDLIERWEPPCNTHRHRNSFSQLTLDLEASLPTLRS
jgi:excinuclease UvrABC nuclease subunit